MAVDSGEEEFAPKGCLVAVQTPRPQCWVLAPADDGGDSLTARCLAPGSSTQCVFFDIFFVFGMRCGLTKGYPTAFVVEATVFCQQDADQEIHGRWVVGVDGCGAVEKENDYAADKVENLPTPMDSRLVCVHPEAKLSLGVLESRLWVPN